MRERERERFMRECERVKLKNMSEKMNRERV